MISVTPTEADVFTALRTFLLGILPAGTAQFNGYIAGNTLIVTSLLESSGSINLGDRVLGTGVAPGTYIEVLGTGSGGTGTYTVSASQTVATAAAPVVMATGVEVILTQVNKVPEPAVDDFVTMTPILNSRLATNVNTAADVVFTASIAGATMTVTEIAQGELQVGSMVFGVGLATPTVVTAFGTGSGGEGNYTVAPAQTIASETMAAGLKSVMQSMQRTIQLDVHGPNSGDFAKIITSLLRDDYAVAQFEQLLPTMIPLYADDARQMPFQNAEQQWETRYIIDALFQVNETLGVPQQYFDAATVTAISVDAANYPS